MLMHILPAVAGLRNISFDIKTRTALEGGAICVLGMPGPVGTYSNQRFGSEVPGAKRQKAALRKRISVTNVPYYNMKKISDSVKSQVKKC